jgi:hypothetical protein
VVWAVMAATAFAAAIAAPTVPGRIVAAPAGDLEELLADSGVAAGTGGASAASAGE